MFRKLALVSVVLTFCLLVSGAYVRIADAGLGCPDWPGCLGQLVLEDSPPQPATASLPEAFKPALKLAHQGIAATLGLFTLVLFFGSFWQRERRWSAAGLSLAALLLVGGQAALGVFGAQWLALPLVVTAQLLAGVLTLGLLYCLSLDHNAALNNRPTVGAGVRALARFSALLLLLQIALGDWVSVNGAGLSCPDFPTCLGSYTPPVDYLAAFSPTLDGDKLTVAARAALHWAHRIGAVAVYLLLTLLALTLTSNPRAPRLSKPALYLNGLLLVQIALGLGSLMLRLPVPLTAAHSAVALLLWLNLLHIVYFLRKPLPHAAPVALQPQRDSVAPRELVEIPTDTLPPLVIPQPAEPEAAPTPVVVREPRRETAPAVPDGLFGRLKAGLGKTRGGLTGFLANLALGKKAIDGDLLEDIEAQLLMADIGINATTEIIRDLTDSLERSELDDVDALTARLREHLYQLIAPVSQPLHIPAETRPFVILVVGVNGVGKTTTIGKLANRLKNQGLSVMLAAGDTFRAAAVEQLQTWGERNDIHVVSQGSGADSASVIFDAVKAAQARGIDVLIADTAGRLHTKSNLMDELSKIKRIMAKLDPAAPHEVLLVLDAGTGQNALSQAKLFNEAVGLTGLAVTKLDGTAKGGVIFALAKQFAIPIRYVGVGETIEDLQDFNAKKFIEALFAE